MQTKSHVNINLTSLSYILIFITAIAYNLPSFNVGINIADEGFLANGVLRSLNGEVPFRDFISYMPGSYLVFVPFFALFGANLLIIRIAWIIVRILSAILIFRITDSITSRTFAFLAALLFIIVPGPSHKSLVLLLGLVNIFVIVHYLKTRSLKSLLFSASVAALTFAFRQDITIYAIFTTLASILLLCLNDYVRSEDKTNRYISLRNYLKSGVIYLAGIMVFIAPFILYAVMDVGLRQKLLYWFYATTSVTIPLPYPKLIYLSSTDLFSNIRLSFEGLLFYLPFIISGTLLIWIIQKVFRRESIGVTHINVFAICIFALMTLNQVRLRADFPHLTQAMAPFYILYAYELGGIYRYMGRLFTQRSWAKAVSLVLVFLLPALYLADMVLYHGRDVGSIGIIREKERLLSVNNAPVYLIKEESLIIDQVVTHIKTNTQPNDYIFVVPYQPMFYFLTDRRNPTYFDMILPGTLKDYAMEIELIENLKRTRPKYIIYLDLVLDNQEDRRFSNYARRLNKFIKANYYVEKKIGPYEVMRLSHNKS